jgi:hypothetical protein
MKASIWQLANDPATYGIQACQFVLTSPDGEKELSPIVFTTAHWAQQYAEKQGWEVVPLDV